MRTALASAAAALSAVISIGCAATLNVSAHLDRSVDFTAFRTYDWGPADALPTGDPRLDANPFFNDHVLGAVERELAKRGLELVSTDTPQLLIHYHANISRRFSVNGGDLNHGYCAVGDCASDVTEYEAGTLVLDIMDARTNRLLWRGWAQNDVEHMLRSRDAMAETIDKAVTQMLQRYPRSN